MAIVFYLIGGLVMLLGALWIGATIYTGGQAGNATVSGIAILAAMPGLYIMFSGLLIMAIGGVLSRLDKIVENTNRPMNYDTSRWSEADRALLRGEPS